MFFLGLYSLYSLVWVCCVSFSLIARKSLDSNLWKEERGKDRRMGIKGVERAGFCEAGRCLTVGGGTRCPAPKPELCVLGP